jgi:hypothetical protein
LQVEGRQRLLELEAGRAGDDRHRDRGSGRARRSGARRAAPAASRPSPNSISLAATVPDHGLDAVDPEALAEAQLARRSRCQPWPIT